MRGTTQTSGILQVRRVAVLCVLLLAGCETLRPALTTLALAFGQDLIASASVNYAPRYARQVESLLVAMANEGTGLGFQEQLAQSGYEPPPPGYAREHNDDAAAQDPYYDDYEEYDGYDGYDDYEGTVTGPGDDPYAAAGDNVHSDEPYYDEGAFDTGLLELEVAVLVRRAGSESLQPVDDGDTVYDGAGDPARGDLLKFHVQSNRAAYLYVIGVDATGYVAQIFPDPAAGLGNPVAPGQSYLLPSGNQWWGLDQQTGVEQIYFVAGPKPRPDIEGITRQLGNQPRQLAVENYLPVRQPAVLPTRGLVKVVSGPVSVPTNAGNVEIVPEAFASADADVAITRWFYHESR